VESLVEHEIRVAGDADMPQVARILASAFTHDPVLDWLSGNSAIYSSFFRCEAEAHYKHHGHVYINHDQTGAAMWLPAGAPLKSPFHWRRLGVAWKLFANHGVEGLKRAGLLDKFMSERHPTESHFYLRSIGADLESQGRGIGSALIQAGLAACDQQGLPAYLESSNVRNNLLYQRHGFDLIGEARLPKNGPTIWFMHRARFGGL
jgi:ribosomal protein S18 acetylase RimI-like enzyme